MRETFLSELAQRGIVGDAARVAGIDRATPYRWRADDAEFRAAWDAALEEAADRAEREAWRRAVEGVDEPVFGRIAKDTDGEIGAIRKYSDQILLRLLGARRPDKWRDRGGSMNVTLTPEELAKMSDDDLEHLKRQLG